MAVPLTSLPSVRRVLTALLLLILPQLADAQQSDEPPPVIPGFFTMGMNEPTGSEGTVNDVRIPIGYTLISPEGRAWGLRLRLIVYAGIYDIDFTEAQDLKIRFESLAATPGVEFLVPVGKGWTLKPFTEIGYARDFDQDLGLGVWSIGMRTFTEWESRDVRLRFGTKIQWLSTFESDLVLADSFFELQLGLDVGFPLGFDIAGSPAYLSPYGIRHQYVDASIGRPNGDPFEITYTNEIGLAFGARPRIKLWFFTLPRIGIGYRWGPNIDGWRLSFGFPF